MTGLFGTDGIRGTAGEYPLDPATILKLGQSLARHLIPRKPGPLRVVVGRDTRASGEWIEEALVGGLIEAGADAKLLGVIPHPVSPISSKRMRRTPASSSLPPTTHIRTMGSRSSLRMGRRSRRNWKPPWRLI